MKICVWNLCFVKAVCTLSAPDPRCTCGSCCVSCCPASTSTWPDWGRTASSCSSATAGSCSASNESSPTPRLCACGRPAGHTIRSGRSPSGLFFFAYTSLWEQLCINNPTEAFGCFTTAPHFWMNLQRLCRNVLTLSPIKRVHVIPSNPVTTVYCNPPEIPFKTSYYFLVVEGFNGLILQRLFNIHKIPHFNWYISLLLRSITSFQMYFVDTVYI